MLTHLHLFRYGANPYDWRMRKTILTLTLVLSVVVPIAAVPGQYPEQFREQFPDVFKEFENPDRMPGARPPESRTAKTISVADYLIPKAARQDFDRGRKQQRQSKCVEALVYFERAVKAYPQYAAAHNEMGNCYVQLGLLDGAERSFKQAVELATTVYPSMNLADVYVQQKRFEDARAVLNSTIRAHAGEGDPYYALALTYFEESRIDDAERAALEADSRQHQVPDLHLLLAKIYLAKQNVPEVVNQLTLFLAEAPSHPLARQVRSDLKRVKTVR